ncbi:Ribosome biogenesis protein nsa1 (NOP7-associated protein 1) [Rhizina undulata]
MKLVVGDDVGQVKVIETRHGIDTSLQSSARPKIVSYIEPDRNAAVQGVCVVRFRGREGMVAVASKGGLIRILDPTASPFAGEEQVILFSHRIPGVAEDEDVTAFSCEGPVLYAGTKSGAVQFLDLRREERGDAWLRNAKFEGPVSAVRILLSEDENAVLPAAVAVGGERRDLEVYEPVTEPDSEKWIPVWKAKNVKPNKLGLEVPIWVRSILFLPSPASSSNPTTNRNPRRGRNQETAAAGSGRIYRLVAASHYSHLRIYDTAVSRRPVFTSVLEPKNPTAVLYLHFHPDSERGIVDKLTDGRDPADTARTVQDLQFVYTDMVGMFGIYSTKQRRSLGIFKGSTGAVLSVATTTHTDDGKRALVAGVGFDRYLRVYDPESREVLSKVYIKSKGTCVGILDSEDEVVKTDVQIEKEEKAREEKAMEEEMWETMEQVNEVDEEDGDITKDLVQLSKVKRRKITLEKDDDGKAKDGKKKRKIR